MPNSSLYCFKNVIIKTPTTPNSYNVHCKYNVHVFMRDEKEERKKQARSNKQTRQSNTAHMQGFRSRSPLSPLARTQLIWRLLGASKSHSWPSRISRVYDGARAASMRVMCRSESMAASTSSSGPVVKRPRISSTDITSVSE